jgi:Ni/Fe-hydrogenase 1 B-type cytochrome subunit
MGYIRFAHFAAGYVLAVGLLGRLLGAGGQPPCARAVHAAAHPRRLLARGAGHAEAWYAFLRPRPNQYVGHNPLARLAMFFGYLLLSCS